jgi:hypothetical protein
VSFPNSTEPVADHLSNTAPVLSTGFKVPVAVPPVNWKYEPLAYCALIVDVPPPSTAAPEIVIGVSGTATNFPSSPN